MLPYPLHAARRRRLNMVAVQSGEAVVAEVADQVLVASSSSVPVSSAANSPRDTTRKSLGLTRGKGYAYREANWQIGRAAETANVQVQKFVPGDRWTAWRKRDARKQASAERKRLRDAGKKTAKPKARKARVV